MFKEIFQRKVAKSNQFGTGGRGEDAAADYLRKKKYKIIAQNWYNPRGKRLGEIDIVAKCGDTVVFVEVKSRSVAGNRTVIPEEQITAVKLRKLQRAAEAYIRQGGDLEVPWRIDAVTVVYREGVDDPEIHHLESIFL